MQFHLILIGLCVLLQTCLSEKTSYTGYKLVRLYPADEEQINIIGQWDNQIDFDIWNGMKGFNKPIDVFLSQVAFQKYSVQFQKFGINYEVVVNNFQKLVEEEERSMLKNRNSDILTKYSRYADIKNYLQSVVENNTDIASSFSAGTTYEKRDLQVLVLKSGSPSKAVWLDCGIHAREWISVATCLNFIDQLVSAYKRGDATVLELFKVYEFYILPIVNPDGYEYTHSSTRMWRKNRVPNAGSSCYGVDLNRNWGHQWMVAGASLDPCQDTFAGSKADSEIETQSIQKIINQKGNFEIFLTLHSYGQFWMIPWAYGSVSPHAALLKAKSNIGAAALKAVSGTSYQIGSVPELLYAAAGGSFDWTHGPANIKHSYCLELRPGQSGADAIYGFLLPDDRIPKVAAETYAGLIALLDSIRKSPDN